MKMYKKQSQRILLGLVALSFFLCSHSLPISDQENEVSTKLTCGDATKYYCLDNPSRCANGKIITKNGGGISTNAVNSVSRDENYVEPVNQPRLWDDDFGEFTWVYNFSQEVLDNRLVLSQVKKAIGILKNIVLYDCVIVREARPSDENFVTFSMDHDGCYSLVGMQEGGQKINVKGTGNGCGAQSTMHEIFHSLGAYHTQSRPDRNHYIKVMPQVFQGDAETAAQFYIYDTDQHGSYFDFNSLMLYGSYADSVDGRPTMLRQPYPGKLFMGTRHLQDSDVDWMRRHYFCHPYPGVPNRYNNMPERWPVPQSHNLDNQPENCLDGVAECSHTLRIFSRPVKWHKLRSSNIKKLEFTNVSNRQLTLDQCAEATLQYKGKSFDWKVDGSKCYINVDQVAGDYNKLSRSNSYWYFELVGLRV